jgi:hypothetical protein
MDGLCPNLLGDCFDPLAIGGVKIALIHKSGRIIVRLRWIEDVLARVPGLIDVRKYWDLRLTHSPLVYERGETATADNSQLGSYGHETSQRSHGRNEPSAKCQVSFRMASKRH